MSIWLTVAVIVAGALAIAGILTVGIRRIFRGRDRLLSADGGSPALRALTATYGLLLAFVLGASLQSFQSAQHNAVSEADAVVALSNLTHVLPASSGVPLRSGLACYASTVVHREYPALQSGSSVPPDDGAPLERLYGYVPSLNGADPRAVAVTQTIMQQLSNLTDQRDARIRAAKSSLPGLLWVLVMGGGVVILVAVAAITFVDRPWPQFTVLAAVAGIMLAVIILINSLDQPFRSDALSVSAGPMNAALVTVESGLPPHSC